MLALLLISFLFPSLSCDHDDELDGEKEHEEEEEPCLVAFFETSVAVTAPDADTANGASSLDIMANTSMRGMAIDADMFDLALMLSVGTSNER